MEVLVFPAYPRKVSSCLLKHWRLEAEASVACGRSLKDAQGRGRTSRSLSGGEAQWESCSWGRGGKANSTNPTRTQGKSSQVWITRLDHSAAPCRKHPAGTQEFLNHRACQPHLDTHFHSMLRDAVGAT